MCETERTTPALQSATDCPRWCVDHKRSDATTMPPAHHPDDWCTLHSSAPIHLRTSKETVLTAHLELWVPDEKDGKEPLPVIEINGDDGSGWVCHLELPFHDAGAISGILRHLADLVDVDDLPVRSVIAASTE